MDRVRQFQPSTNLVLAVLAGLGLLASTSLHWYAAPTTDPNQFDGPIETAAYHLGQTFSTTAPGQLSGSAALGSGMSVLVLLVAVIALLALAVWTPSLREHAETGLQLVALATPVVVIVVAVLHSGTHASVRPHSGVVIAFAISLVTASAAWQGATMRQKRKVPAGTVRISGS